MAYHQPSNIHLNCHAELEVCLNEILSFIKPTTDDTFKRRNVINEIADAIKTDQSLVEIGASVKPFGSYISNLYTRWGNLDISIDVTLSKHSPAGRNHKIKVLQQVIRALQRTGVAINMEFIRSARVPLVTYQSKYYNISCDISIDNHAGYVKSHILHLISNIDERFCAFVLLIKEWAKAQHVNDSKTGTLDSYSICLLVVFHFQTCRPVIFPPLKDLYEGNLVDDAKGQNNLTRVKDSFAASIARYTCQISRQRNQSSLAELFTSFFEKFSGIDSLASNYVICTYTGKWEPINSNNRWMWKVHNLLIEDPFEQSENAARAVGFRGLLDISRAFADMYKKLLSNSVVKDQSFVLNNLVRPEINSKLKAGRQQIHNLSQARIDRIQQPRDYLVNPASLPPPSTSRSYERLVTGDRQVHDRTKYLQ